MTADIMTRSNEVVDTMARQMHMVSNGACAVRGSHIQQHQPDRSLGEDVMGVFAQRDIPAGEVIFVDRTTTGVTMVEGDRCSLCCAVTTRLGAVNVLAVPSTFVVQIALQLPLWQAISQHAARKPSLSSTLLSGKRAPNSFPELYVRTFYYAISNALSST